MKNEWGLPECLAGKTATDCVCTADLCGGMLRLCRADRTGAMLDLGTRFNFVYMALGELVNCYFRLALAVVLASPIILYQIWAFVRPALVKKEKRAILFGLFGGLFFFALGVVFAYFIAIPFLLKFF